ncbi:hypothetical protein AYI70_g9909 [Smittium culicis]|uniref:Uncharacterized protein n=1 Tax=Smittium culicis TaxID=133412 RepID=A0A1R1X927_9FUNG|nr:hypothetical protein AYI70_g9909 [Smittium culicis]
MKDNVNITCENFSHNNHISACCSQVTDSVTTTSEYSPQILETAPNIRISQVSLENKGNKVKPFSENLRDSKCRISLDAENYRDIIGSVTKSAKNLNSNNPQPNESEEAKSFSDSISIFSDYSDESHLNLKKPLEKTISNRNDYRKIFPHLLENLGRYISNGNDKLNKKLTISDYNKFILSKGETKSSALMLDFTEIKFKRISKKLDTHEYIYCNKPTETNVYKFYETLVLNSISCAVHFSGDLSKNEIKDPVYPTSKNKVHRFYPIHSSLPEMSIHWQKPIQYPHFTTTRFLRKVHQLSYFSDEEKPVKCLLS